MSDDVDEPNQRLDRQGYVLEIEDTFQRPTLDERLWIAHYLPHWSSRRASAARYEVGGGLLQLRIEADQEPWNPDLDGDVRVSSLQTGSFAGPVGSVLGQHQFRRGLVVREAQESVALYTPYQGLFELRARALDDPATMVALWMIGYEDEPTRSAEICVCEIFGRDVGPDTARIGMGLHPFGDPSITDAFSTESVRIDARQTHTYSVEWAADFVAFYVDDRLVKVVRQSPSYPMQFMLSIYEFRGRPDAAAEPSRYPKVFAVEAFRGYRRKGSAPALRR
jgi:Glycosyl hydrolases family 16